MIVEKARQILENGYSLCDSCLGRLFGLRGHGVSNAERGRSIKTLLFLEAYRSSPREFDERLLRALAESGFEPARSVLASLSLEVPPVSKCYICGGISSRYEELALRILEATSEYEFSTFQLGVRLPYQMVKREEDIWRLFELKDAESLKNEVSREVGKIFSKISGKVYGAEKSEVLIIIDIGNGRVEVHPRPVFICGRYRKLVRGLPQNPWPYTDDRIKFKTSIEELVSRPAITLFEAFGAKFHAGGREDIDVRTLGRGRPFVLEIKRPKKRSIDLAELEKKINMEARGLIEVHGLSYCDRDSIKKLKGLAEVARKVYRALVTFSTPITEEDISKLNTVFNVAVVEQRTPFRVLHRRVDKLRRKVVYRVEAKRVSEREVELVIEAQGGFYIKEFIHGDQGRTNPSIAGVLGKSVENIELDVLDVD
ncbi:tRNA pseudouridine(54/55) synthase Pus10 [Infirmifilum lucidum]|uniref:tRNA pseudouridine synthase Pus10 n=1 Tax=Infirmifilum lucidum TaxID=2776706 RepID=A0A7L9FHN4_9CREN|nr:tRNA pseudouridine(54/55) synthase Pus10 [Infirmifilum lucidum]QOJ78285.1 tRNA pseudouridine(54/55) synthase Pus10 [Infirmifilum lucidum]